MYIKKLISLFVFLFFCIYVTAQSIDLQKLSERKRNKQVAETAKEVVMVLAPDHYREYKKPIVMGPYDYDARKYEHIPNRDQYIGKKYYIVIIPYDFAKENLDYDFAAKVAVWADDGTPMSFQAGSSRYTISFQTITFEERLKEGLPEEIRPVYHQRQPKYKGGDVPQWDPNAKRSWEKFDEEYKKEHENK